MSFDYYYGMEAESFSFYRIPRVLVTDPFFHNLSTDAKLLYGLLLDRMGLSMRNGWLDEDNRVYIYYTLEEIQNDLNCGHGKAVKLLAELDTAKGVGLIERVRQGLGKPDMIYVKQFLPGTGDNCAQTPRPKSGSPDFSKSNFQTSENRTSGVPKTELPDFRKADASYIDNNYTDLNHTYLSYTDPSIYPSLQEVDLGQMDRWTAREYVKAQIEYAVLTHNNPREPLIDSMTDLITDVLRSNAPSERINGANIPIRDVQSCFRAVTCEHIQYVVDAMKQTAPDVTNLRAYLVTALYNAVRMMDAHVDAAVRHDFQ